MHPRLCQKGRPLANQVLTLHLAAAMSAQQQSRDRFNRCVTRLSHPNVMAGHHGCTLNASLTVSDVEEQKRNVTSASP